MVGWEATAAYFYVLRLDRFSLAWEYLRRNPEYRRHWQQRTITSVSAARWGCAALENPNLDARHACPEWLSEPTDLVSITRGRDNDTAGDRFSVWGIGGQRVLSHAGSHIHLHANNASVCTHVRIDPQLNDGDSYAFIVRADNLLRERMRVASELVELLKHSRAKPSLVRKKLPSRTAWTHARTLQALDGVQEGASHRDIAIAIFGTTRVQDHWSSDSELRAQVRYFVRRGQVLMNDGYRSLLLPEDDAAQGEN